MLAPGQLAGEALPANTSLFGIRRDGGHQLDQLRHSTTTPAAVTSTNDGNPTVGPIVDHRQLRRPRHHQGRRRPERQRRQPDRLRRHDQQHRPRQRRRRQPHRQPARRQRRHARPLGDRQRPSASRPASASAAPTAARCYSALANQPISLAPNTNLSVHVTAASSATSCAAYDNSASVTSTNDGSATAGPVTITVNCGALAITKTADAPSVSAGSPIGYVVTVTNTGAVTADVVSPSATPCPDNNGRPQLDHRRGRLELRLDDQRRRAGATARPTLGARRLGPRPHHQSDHGGELRDCQQPAGRDQRPTTAIRPSALLAIVVPCPQNPALQVRKGVSLNPNGPFLDSVTTTVGTTVYYQIIVTNTGDVMLTGVTLTELAGAAGLVRRPQHPGHPVPRSRAPTAESPSPGPRRTQLRQTATRRVPSPPRLADATVIAPTPDLAADRHGGFRRRHPAGSAQWGWSSSACS